MQTWCHEYSTRPLQPSRSRPQRPKSRPVSVSPLAYNAYSYAPFIAKSKAACGLCFNQLGGHIEPPWLVCKYEKKVRKGNLYSITDRRVPELIPVLGSQPAGDVSHKPGGRLPLLSARPAVIPQPLRGLLPILLLGEQRHNGCKQFA